MLIYRICKEEEINNIFKDRNYSNVGKTCKIDKKLNTHSYESEKKYIHFFKNFDSIFYLDSSENHFICTYDIPKYLLQKRIGTGYYLDRINFKTLENVTEFALDNIQVDFNHLKKVEKIIDYIDFEDYMDNNISSKIKTYYLNKDDKVDKQVKNIDLLYDIMMADDIVQSINLNFNFIIDLIPELNSMIGFEHKHPHHHLDVWEHTLYALSLSKANFDVRIALLLHDTGKPFSYVEEDGIRHFLNHANVSSKISSIVLNRLGFDNKYIDEICKLIKIHDTPITREDVIKDYSTSYTLYQIQISDALAHNPNKLEKRKKYLDDVKKLMLKKN